MEFIHYHFTRYYYANVDETRRKIKELTKEGEWDSDEFPAMKQTLLNRLNVQDISDQESLLDMFKQMFDDLQVNLSNVHKKLDSIQMKLLFVRFKHTK